jgi:hypothetical protein
MRGDGFPLVQMRDYLRSVFAMTRCLTQASLRSMRTLGCAPKPIAPGRIASSAAAAVTLQWMQPE